MRLVSFWGKGGVGKTTCSASLAAGLSEEGMDVLLLTTDPTPTLSDVLGFPLGPEPSRVEGFRGLWAAELSENAVIEMWKERFGEEVFEVASSFLPVERDFIDYVARAPGIADQFMLYLLYEYWSADGYDLIIWDTPASSGSIRLLRLEEEFYSHMNDAVRMYLRLKGFLERIRRGKRDPLELIEEWRSIARGIMDMLSSDYHRLILVSIPERISYLLTMRMREELEEMGIDVWALVVNRLFRGCGCDKLSRMVEIHERVLEEFKASFDHVRVIENVDYEPVGREGLLRFYEFLRELV